LNLLLERPELRQLAQRITARYHLTPLSADETSAYVEHRLSVAGNTHQLFDTNAVRDLFQASGGIPRVINVLADHSLLAAFAQGADRVSRAHVARARAEVMPLATARRQQTRTLALWVLGLLALGIGAFYLYAARQIGAPDKPVPNSGSATPIANESAAVPAAPDAIATYLQYFGLTPTPELREILERCPIQISPGLRCLHAKVPTEFVKAANQPYLVRINQRWQISSAALVQPEWQILALYALPDDVPQAFTQGYAGPGVGLLASQLAKRDGGSALQKIYGPRMAERVMRLQRDLGITADGVVGPATWLALNLRQ
jgi:general secretion pathway protein A